MPFELASRYCRRSPPNLIGRRSSGKMAGDSTSGDSGAAVERAECDLEISGIDTLRAVECSDPGVFPSKPLLPCTGQMSAFF
jgi:hypothetical protein